MSSSTRMTIFPGQLRRQNRTILWLLLTAGLAATLASTLYSIQSLEDHRRRQVSVTDTTTVNDHGLIDDFVRPEAQVLRPSSQSISVDAVVASADHPKLRAPKRQASKNMDEISFCTRGTLCHVVGAFVQSRRNDILTEVEKSEWAWHLPHVAAYYEHCVVAVIDTNDKIFLELGEVSSGYGASGQYMLDHLGSHKSNLEYHLMDTFTVKKGMQRVFRRSAPKAHADEISKAWEASMTDSELGIIVHDSKTSNKKLQIHRATSGSILDSMDDTFQDTSVNVIYVDNLQTTFVDDQTQTQSNQQIIAKLLVKLQQNGTLILSWRAMPLQDKDDWVAAVKQALSESKEPVDVRWIDLDNPSQAIVSDGSNSYDCDALDPVLRRIDALAAKTQHFEDEIAEYQHHKGLLNAYAAPKDA
ncbi:MAG: hypothetical protein SGILL_006735, partial [Bacillariaceae sp.]